MGCLPMQNAKPNFLNDQTGATAVEYGMILAMIFLAMIGAVQAFGINAVEMWTNMATTIVEASGH
jgi:pilus assembly protein Flp/PilA